jgi:hypothetical protein
MAQLMATEASCPPLDVAAGPSSTRLSTRHRQAATEQRHAWPWVSGCEEQEGPPGWSPPFQPQPTQPPTPRDPAAHFDRRLEGASSGRRGHARPGANHRQSSVPLMGNKAKGVRRQGGGGDQQRGMEAAGTQAVIDGEWGGRWLLGGRRRAAG